MDAYTSSTVKGTYSKNKSRITPVMLSNGLLRKRTKNCSESLFVVINKYLWLHAVGFENSISCARKQFISISASVFLSVITDGPIFLYLCRYLLFIFQFSISNSKGEIANTIIITTNIVFRIYFYIERRKFRDIIRKLADIYSTIGINKKKVKKFRFYLITFLITNDILFYSNTLHMIYKKPLITDERDLFSGIQYHAYSAIIFLYYFSMIYSAVTGYFSCVCFMLRECFKSLNEKFLHCETHELENICCMYREVSGMISSINEFLHPFLLMTFTLLLSNIFRETFHAVYVTNGVPVITRLLYISIHLSHFVCLCLFGSSVRNAASGMRMTAQNLLAKPLPQSILHTIIAMKDGVEGFKLLDTAVINAGLIPTAIGSLLTYGMLIASVQSQK